MGNTFRQQKSSDMQQTSGFLAISQIFNGIFNWLASLIKLTDEERENAGIYLGGEGKE